MNEEQRRAIDAMVDKARRKSKPPGVTIAAIPPQWYDPLSQMCAHMNLTIVVRDFEGIKIETSYCQDCGTMFTMS